MSNKTMIVNSKGMVTIPAKVRKKYGIKEGSEIAILEIEGEIKLVPLLDYNQLQEILPSRTEMEKTYEETRIEEIALENSKIF